ncbi:MAG TPA: 2-phospho-L-lactate guanylyltransferase [Ktedonobacterales bacterium]|jgi:2-phospho-L-lactate guanylyltransferase|nr:2-phospho-L-lactate guanylyltransferase [Ktedonobacterales bacterium]
MSHDATTTFALVPLNASAASKTRLRVALHDSEREALTRWLAARVLSAITASCAVPRTAVVSPDPNVLKWVQGFGAVPLLQQTGELNDGLELGRRWAVREGAGALLVVLGDLPLLRQDEVTELVRLGQGADSQHKAVLAPDREEHGTNALLQRPAELVPFAFGEGSFQRHRELIRTAGAGVAIYRSPGTSFDVDMPLDLRELRARKLWPAVAGADVDNARERERNAS